MKGSEVIPSLHAEAVHTLEAKAKSLRDQIEGRGGDREAERRLEIIERILRRIFEHSLGA